MTPLGFGLGLGFNRGGGESWTPAQVVGTTGYWDGKLSPYTDAGSGDNKISKWASVHDQNVTLESPAAANNPVRNPLGYISTAHSVSLTTKQYLLIPGVSSVIPYKTAIILAKPIQEYTINMITANSLFAGGSTNIVLRGTSTYNCLAIAKDNVFQLTSAPGEQAALNQKSISTYVLNGNDSVLRINGVGKSLVNKTGTAASFKELFQRGEAYLGTVQFAGDVYAMYFNSNVLSLEDIIKIEDYLIALHGIGA